MVTPAALANKWLRGRQRVRPVDDKMILFLQRYTLLGNKRDMYECVCVLLEVKFSFCFASL